VRNPGRIVGLTGFEPAIPWPAFDSPYAAWFIDEQMRGPNAIPKRPVPNRLLFQDSHGSVMLVGCWGRLHHVNLMGPGSGLIQATYAVLGVENDLDYRYLNGIQSEISGLRNWLGVSSVTESVEWSPPRIATVTATSAAAIAVGEGEALRLLPTWKLDHDEDAIIIRDRVLCDSRSEVALDWAEMQKQHFALRDLLVISQWRAEVSSITHVSRNDDTYTSQAGEISPLWREIIPARPFDEISPIRLRRHLIQYSEIGVAGVSKWLALRDSFARALDPIISTRYLKNATPLTLLAQSGPGIEALGYLILRRDGIKKDAAAAQSLRARLDRILLDVGDVLPFDGEVWASKTVATYNSLKHANRKPPIEIDMINRWRETCLVLRAWVALELGTPRVDLTARIKEDAQSHPYSLMTP